MKLIKLDIITNREITGDKNSLQFIDRAEKAMFLDYNNNLDGAIYLVQESSVPWIIADLKRNNLKYEIVSTHEMREI